MNNTHSINITQQGLDELKAEYQELKDQKLPAVIARVQSAREQGDLSENSEYHAARDEHSMIMGRMEELEELISRAKVISKPQKSSVSIGSKVTVGTTKGTHQYHIVGKYESDPANKKISDESPLGKALLGKKVGQDVTYEAPVGKIIYKIVSID